MNNLANLPGQEYKIKKVREKLLLGWEPNQPKEATEKID